MNAEFNTALKVCQNWVELLCLDALMVSRPIVYNKPVSEKTIGFDVILPSGRTIQTAIAYLQYQVFSKPYGVVVASEGKEEAAHQLTFGITERNIYTSLFVHADQLGLRVPSRLALLQVVIICRVLTQSCTAAAGNFKSQLAELGIRAKVLYANNDIDVFSESMIRGYPIQIILDDALISKGTYELLDRRTLELKCLKLSADKADFVRKALIIGDRALLREQQIRKKLSTRTLSRQEFIAEHEKTSSAQKNSCFEVVVHENRSCIALVQGFGVGEYIGTDQQRRPTAEDSCFGCGRPCETIGYVSKRL